MIGVLQFIECLDFVSGHGFSRAEEDVLRRALTPVSQRLKPIFEVATAARPKVVP